MASPTRITKRRRKMKRHNIGKVRKRMLRQQGSTKSMEELFGLFTD